MTDVFLVAVVEVEKVDRIICQASGCGHGVFRRIHIALVDGQFILLGSDCFQRLYGTKKKAYLPYYQWNDGRRLSEEERKRLLQNTADFIEQLETERLQHAKSSTNLHGSASLQSPVQNLVVAKAAERTRFMYNTNERSAHPYEGPEVLKWMWASQQAITSASLVAFKTDTSPDPNARLVVECYEKMTFKTPYLFALEVELRHYLPKKNTLRVLHELGLIAQV